MYLSFAFFNFPANNFPASIFLPNVHIKVKMMLYCFSPRMFGAKDYRQHDSTRHHESYKPIEANRATGPSELRRPSESYRQLGSNRPTSNENTCRSSPTRTRCKSATTRDEEKSRKSSTSLQPRSTTVLTSDYESMISASPTSSHEYNRSFDGDAPPGGQDRQFAPTGQDGKFLADDLVQPSGGEKTAEKRSWGDEMCDAENENAHVSGDS